MAVGSMCYCMLMANGVRQKCILCYTYGGEVDFAVDFAVDSPHT